jgi:hypothetical protein
MKRKIESKSEALSIMEDHEKRISALEKKLKSPKPHDITKIKSSLPSYVIKIRDEGFFSKPKTVKETHQKLQESYTCEEDRVVMALLRLARKRELRKATKSVNNKIQKAYVW